MGMEMVYSEIGHELKPHVMIHSVTQIKLKSKTYQTVKTFLYNVETQLIRWA